MLNLCMVVCYAIFLKVETQFPIVLLVLSLLIFKVPGGKPYWLSELAKVCPSGFQHHMLWGIRLFHVGTPPPWSVWCESLLFLLSTAMLSPTPMDSPVAVPLPFPPSWVRSTFCCGEAVLPVFRSFSGLLHWCQCYLVVLVGWGWA